MKKGKKEKHFINKPSYPGGPKALWAFIRRNLKYPKEASENQISGVVRLKYTIDGKGSISEVHVMHSLGYGCDEEAMRVIRLLKYDVPKQRKVRVKFHRTINIKFKPPKRKTLKVNYTASTGKKEEIKEKNSGSYEYTISIPNQKKRDL